MEETNWLDEGAQDDSWLDEVREPGELVLVPRGKSTKPIPQNETELEAALVQAWSELRPKQQIFLDSLKRHSFNIRATCRALEQTNDKICRNTVTGWNHSDENFRFVLKALKAITRHEVLEPETLVLRANDIAEQALHGTPIIYKGKVIGREPNFNAALGANEQLMKVSGLLKGDKDQGRVVVRIVNLAGMDEAEVEAIDSTAEVLDG